MNLIDSNSTYVVFVIFPFCCNFDLKKLTIDVENLLWNFMDDVSIRPPPPFFKKRKRENKLC